MGEELSRGEEAKEGYDDYYEYESSSSTGTASCGCFRGICYSWRRPDGYMNMICDQREEEEEAEAVKSKEKKWKKAKVLVLWAVLGGQKWKNLIRHRLRLRLRMNKKRRSSMQVLQYDPKSYALNFDDGTEKESDGDAAYVGFSARYAHNPSPLGIINQGDSECSHVTQLSKVLDLIPL